ncbi:MAG: DUF1549 domain-containing protein, partial [Planctomycetales bacterium]|nr:DUF1549 domain-containing protein [Planctomycetales bacterium]
MTTYRQLHWPLFLIFIATAWARPGWSQDTAPRAFFEQKIRPVLIEHCYPCHSQSAEKLKGGLRLDSQAGWQAGGDSGTAVIVPGQPEASLLIQYVRHEDGLEMPPDQKLPQAIIADLIAWIRDGAFDPRTAELVEVNRGDKSWWSLQPLQKFDVQGVDGARTIDDFIRAELAKRQLTLSPAAEPRSLIRRMSYDMLGLPPTAEEVEEFVAAYAQDAQAATETLVDRLLDSPHYGEQWGRHWLDVVRFGESIGFERNVIIDDLWPFRDYVIESFNADKPFDQFIREHLAGDVLGRDQPSTEIGSAFLVAGPYDDVGNQDVVAQANIRAATLDEIITATSGAFLGLTINCARCHDHKFDPIPTEDYYRLRAAFEGVRHGRRVVATSEARRRHAAAIAPLEAERARLAAQLASMEQAIEQRALAEYRGRTFTRAKIDPQYTEERFPPAEAKFVKFRMHAHTASPSSAVNGRLVEFEVWTGGDNPRNVALAAHGARAEGPRSAIAEDFPAAYGPQFTIDGRHGEQWFVGNPAELVISLARPETIARIAFSNAKGIDIQDKAQGATPCEYDVQISGDGEHWQTVASSQQRQPWSDAHGAQRLRREVMTEAEAEQLRQLQEQLAKVQEQLDAIPPLPQVWVGDHIQPNEPTRRHIGGDPQKEGEVIAPASLAVIEGSRAAYELPSDAPESERRVALAQWITADDNPLTARVLANRVWQYHFGTGIVDTPSDFGYLGGVPSHPQLLDWLAGQLLQSGWRLKPLHRQILLSQTYRQSSDYRPAAAAVDQDARWLWRFPPRRLSAEELRDTLLLVAGELQGYCGAALSAPATGGTSQTPAGAALAGGPGFRLYKFTQNNVCTYFPLERHGPETYRRAVYHQNARASV